MSMPRKQPPVPVSRSSIPSPPAPLLKPSPFVESNSQVSLRGSSAKEISRDLLLRRVLNEREIRSFDRRAAAASLFIQRVWRRYHAVQKLAEQLHEEWEGLVQDHSFTRTNKWISERLLRPFLLFVTQSATLHHKHWLIDQKCTSTCFDILLQSINSPEPEENFCFFTIGTLEEKSSWLYQSRKLVSICSLILEDHNGTCAEGKETVAAASLAMRLVVALTDSKSWKCFHTTKPLEADISARKLIGFMATKRSGFYNCLRVYIMKQPAHFSMEKMMVSTNKDNILITASAMTLALRPFHVKKIVEADFFHVKDAAEQFVSLILTIPHLTRSLPHFLLPALKHEDVLFPCLEFIMNFKDEISDEMSKLDRSMISSPSRNIISSGWALVNIMNLATEIDQKHGNAGCFVQGLDCDLYLNVLTFLAESLFRFLNCVRPKKKDNCDNLELVGYSPNAIESNEVLDSYVNLFQPVHQQWHLLKLLNMLKYKLTFQAPSADAMNPRSEFYGSLEVLNIVRFYCYILKIHSFINPSTGPLPLLNVLSFAPGFIVELWKGLEDSIFYDTNLLLYESKPFSSMSENYHDTNLEKRQRVVMKDTGSKFTNILQKFTGKSSDATEPYFNDVPSSSSQINEDAYTLWDVKPMRQGFQGISKDLSLMLHLFCSVYAHLLLVLDDIDFYEKQVPFLIQQQQRIAAMVNTFVYNTFVHNAPDNKPVMDVAIKCLHLLYERDSRRKFCPSTLWVAPAIKNRIPIVAAVRAHEASLSSISSRAISADLCMSDIITILPHVYPFEERVEMFREFVNLDKTTRRAALEVPGRVSRSVNVVIRRDHIIEDGFRQLNFLGSKLKSGINVSFINESGLSEAGLDYGGLSKEFLTELARDAFDPRYGLFCSTSTSERALIPNTSARLLENGFEMMEFLGRIVGKALYEGILLEFSFSLVFVEKLLGRYSFLDELSTLDPELYRNLMYVKNFDGDVSELSLDFTITEELSGKRVISELIPGGKNVSVSNENKLQYVHAIADYKLNRQILPLANAFYRGMIDLISSSWLSLFNANEFNQLLSGGEHDLDVDDLKRNTKYTGYSEGSRTIRLFWEVVTGFKPSERCLLLKFVTSCSRAPLLGFKYLHPPFTVHKVVCDMPLWATIGGQDVDRLPSALTCYNTLKLPTYKRSSTLRNKLLYAISSNAGFELS